MALAIDTVDGRGLNNEVRRELLPKELEQGNAVFAVHFTVKKAFNQLYITNKTEHFSFKSGHAVQFAKLIKEDCYSKNFSIKQLHKSIITKILEYKACLNRRIKFVCIAMCSLVMSLCSCDLLVTSFLTYTHHLVFRW